MPENSDLQRAAGRLADAFLAGEFAPRPMAKRAAKLFLKPWLGLPALCALLAGNFGISSRPGRRDLIAAIASSGAFGDWMADGGDANFDFAVPTGKPVMRAAKGNPSTWDLPAITSPIGLARWLDLTEPELRWFARPWRRPNGDLQHYHHHWIAKRRGGHRLIERPKGALKLIQQRILHRVLDHIPPHEAAHSFRPGRSVVSYAEPHCAQPLLLRLDIADFFPTLHAGRVRALFRTAGYPDEVASLLADLCCRSTPDPVLTKAPTPLSWLQKKRLRSPHLPQGAPTSPALSNLLGYRLDCRLAGLARSTGASYTRYADDLAFSGDRRIARLAPQVGSILLEEGFTPNHRKTRLQRKSTRQQLGGTIVNGEKPNIARNDYDQLKAILTNCARRGPSGEDRNALGAETFRQHLRGRIGWVASLNPTRGARLTRLFETIEW